MMSLRLHRVQESNSTSCASNGGCDKLTRSQVPRDHQATTTFFRTLDFYKYFFLNTEAIRSYSFCIQKKVFVKVKRSEESGRCLVIARYLASCKFISASVSKSTFANSECFIQITFSAS